MKEFLSEYGLYKKYILTKDYEIGNQNFVSPADFVGLTFQYECEKEESQKTFEIDLEPYTKLYYSKQVGNKIPDHLFKDETLDFTFKAIGKCKSCNEYHITFLLHVYSDFPISNVIASNTDSINYENYMINFKMHNNVNIYIQKIGINPKMDIKPEKVISKYFERETNNWYYKGINCINENYGIGAFAYFRRIIEKELINIIEDIKSLPDSSEAQITSLLEEHNKHPKVHTIYEKIFPYLPNSLKSLGDNPIRLLYNQTSEGLHSYTEEECLKRAETILKLLKFVIIKINEEKSELKELKDHIKNLK